MTDQDIIDQAAQVIANWSAYNGDPLDGAELVAVAQALADAGLLTDPLTQSRFGYACAEKEKARAERDALAATVQRVRELAEVQAQTCRNQCRADIAHNWQLVLDILDDSQEQP